MERKKLSTFCFGYGKVEQMKVCHLCSAELQSWGKDTKFRRIVISPASWSAVAQKSLGKTAVDKETNRYIEDLKLQIEETCNKLRQKNYPLNIENFKLMFQSEDNEYSTIKTLFEYHMIMEGKNSPSQHATNTELP